MQQDVLNLLAARKGHFLLESGHHGDLWLDLEVLCLRPRKVQPLAAELANRLRKSDVEMVCGPLVEGAFVGLMVAAELDAGYTYSQRFVRSSSSEASSSQGGLFPAGYRLPDALRERVRRRRVAIVNDVINAGSAVRGTCADLEECGAIVVAMASLLVLGDAALRFAASKKFLLETIVSLPNPLWTQADCPLCAAKIPVEDVAGFRAELANGA